MTQSRSMTATLHPGDQTLADLAPMDDQPGLEDLPHPGGLVAGTALALYALKRRDLVGLFSAGVSAGLLYHSARQNGFFDGTLMRRILHTRTRRMVPFERQLIIDRPPADVYEFWRDPRNLAIHLPHIRDVRLLDDTRSHWQLKLTDATYLEWIAERVRDEPQKLLVWRSCEPSDLSHDGWVGFEPLRDGKSTRLTIRLFILAPGGRPGARFVQWLETLPVRYFTDNLQHIRTVLESSPTAPLDGPAIDH